VGGVFDYFEVVAASKGDHAGDVTDLAAVMDGHDGCDFAAGGQFGFDAVPGVGGVQVEVFRAAVDEDGAGVEVADDFGGGSEGHCRHENALPCFEPDCFEGQVKGGGAGVQSNGVLLS
jgi:hypothetical protein